MSNTANNNIPFVPENTIDPAAGLNEALNVIDMLLQLAVVTVNTNTPPASPAEGDRHVVGQAPTGAWAGRAGLVARYLDGYWNFLPARLALNLADGILYARSTTIWTSVAGSGGAAWGGITGSLSAQTDLVNALGLKVDKVTGKQLSTEDFTSGEKTKLSLIAPGATANDTDANLKNRANHTGFQAISTVTDLQTTLDAKIPLTQRGAASGVATLDAAGKIPVSQLPPLAVNEVFTVASQAAMLALTAERGDVAIRTDQAGRAYILSADAPGTLANWISLDQALSVALAALNALTPAADRLPYFDGTSTAALAVFTAQARTLLAAVSQAAQKTVLGLDLVDNTADVNKPVSAPQLAALADTGGQNLVYNSAFRRVSTTAGLAEGFAIDGGGSGGTGVYSLVAAPFGGEFAQRIDVTGIGVSTPNRGIFIPGNRRIPAIEGQPATASAYFRATTGMSARLFLRPISATGTSLPGQIQTVILATGGVQRITAAIASLPANTAFVDIYLRLTGGASVTDGFVEFFRPKVSFTTNPDGWNEDDILTREDTALKAPLASPSFTGPANFAGGVAVNASSLTVTDGNLSVIRTSGTPTIILDAPAGTQKNISVRSGNSERWRFGGSSAAETGSNNGADFFISRYDDAGAGISTPLSIARATAMVTLAQLTVNGPTLSVGPLRPGAYTLSSLPSASTYQNYLIIVTNATGGAKVCWSNGTNWCLLNTSTVVS